jgi:hypothetical protein
MAAFNDTAGHGAPLEAKAVAVWALIIWISVLGSFRIAKAFIRCAVLCGTYLQLAAARFGQV